MPHRFRAINIFIITSETIIIVYEIIPALAFINNMIIDMGSAKVNKVQYVFTINGTFVFKS
jgi:hypothetical protein